MRIVITGATGFLGAAVVGEFSARNANIGVLTRRELAGSRLELVADRITAIRGSFLNSESYRGQLLDFAPHAIVHCAWSGVEGALRNDLGQFDNLPATAALVDIACRAGVKIIVGVGSQAEYGPCEGPTSETASPRPTTLYGITKLAAGQALLQMAAERGMRGVWARIYSLYGPGDEGPWLVPSMIRAFRSGRAPQVTACEQMWEFLHVADAARAIASLVRCDSASGLYNVGSGSPVRLREVILALRDLVAPGISPMFGALPYRSDQIMHLQADITRLTATTNWRPQVPLEEGLAETAAIFAAKEPTA
jgi:UDP-glucose 4-epimerase